MQGIQLYEENTSIHQTLLNKNNMEEKMAKQQLTTWDSIIYYASVIFTLGGVYIIKVMMMKAIADTRK